MMNRIELEPGDYLDWRYGSGDNTVEIYDIAIHSVRRAGKGRKLLNKLLESSPQRINLVFAIARSTNIIARQFYEALGFRVIANLWNFYKDIPVPNCIDAIMYGRDIPCV